MKNDEEDAVLQGKIVEIVFNNAQTTIESQWKVILTFKISIIVFLDDPIFVCSFVKILYEFSQFSFAESLIDQIYSM